MDWCGVLAPQPRNGGLPRRPARFTRPLSLWALSKGRAFDRLPPTLLRAVLGALIPVACTQTIRNGLTLAKPYKQTGPICAAGALATRLWTPIGWSGGFI